MQMSALTNALPICGNAPETVSVATALILFEAYRQRKAAGWYDRCRLDPNTYERLLFEWSYPRVARMLRDRGEPYPELTEDGYLASVRVGTSTVASRDR